MFDNKCKLSKELLLKSIKSMKSKIMLDRKILKKQLQEEIKHIKYYDSNYYIHKHEMHV